MIATATPLHADARAVSSTASTLAPQQVGWRRGEILWPEGCGFADLDTRAPVTPQYGFRIGTAPIVLTTAAAGLLLETVTLAGKLACTAGHNGTLAGGSAASVVTFPEQELAVPVLANIRYADTFALARHIRPWSGERSHGATGIPPIGATVSGERMARCPDRRVWPGSNRIE